MWLVKRENPVLLCFSQCRDFEALVSPSIKLLDFHCERMWWNNGLVRNTLFQGCPITLSSTGLDTQCSSEMSYVATLTLQTSMVCITLFQDNINRFRQILCNKIKNNMAHNVPSGSWCLDKHQSWNVQTSEFKSRNSFIVLLLLVPSFLSLVIFLLLGHGLIAMIYLKSELFFSQLCY